MKFLIIDNYDSFVYNIAQRLGELGISSDVIRNDQITIDEIRKRDYNAIIISPGPGTPEDKKYFGICKDVIMELGSTTPILGVCLGHQGIIACFGGKVVNAGNVRHGKTSLIKHYGDSLLNGVKNPFRATRYHSLVGDKTIIPDSLKVTAIAEDDGEIMGVSHKKHLIEGVQFHPESIMTDEGKKSWKISSWGLKMIKELAEQLSHGNNLTIDQMTSVMDEILTGTQNDEDVAEFLKNLTEKGESDDELLAMLNKMEEFALHISPNCQGKIIDVCGTGGDKLKTFNISTAASFVIAGAGGNVAKHGNRSISGVSGSADIFEYFGFDLNSEPSKVNEIIEKFGIGFMFAQKFHPAMKNVANARKVVGGRTAFNLLGPLTNPAMVKNQLIGVFSDDYQERIVKILQRKNAETIMTVRSDDGMDELSTTSKNKICLLKNNIITNMVIDPQDVGLQRGNISDIQINTKEDAIKSFVDVLNDTANKTKIEITALNAAGGLIVSDIANSFDEAVELALDTIHSGKAFDKLKNFVKNCGDMEKLEGVEKS